jgi:hypothetical protein
LLETLRVFVVREAVRLGFVIEARGRIQRRKTLFLPQIVDHGKTTSFSRV